MLRAGAALSFPRMVNPAPPNETPAPRPDRLPPLLAALRPRQWSKNALLFAGMLFTINHRHTAGDYGRVVLGFCLFCLLSGTAYLVNDIKDRDADRQHPRKRFRPIASGRLPVQTAWLFFALAAPLALAVGGWLIGPEFLLIAGLYFALTLAYSFYLKHVVVIDVMVVAAGFVLRALAGTAAAGVEASVWLLLCTGLLALFLALNKRRGEIVALGDRPATRAILADYSLPLLDQMINIVASTCLMAYALYTFFSDTGKHRPYLMATIPFVLYGLFRYLYLSYRRNEGEAPELVLAGDVPLRLNLLLWTLTAALALLVGSDRRLF